MLCEKGPWCAVAKTYLPMLRLLLKRQESRINGTAIATGVYRNWLEYICARKNARQLDGDAIVA